MGTVFMWLSFWQCPLAFSRDVGETCGVWSFHGDEGELGDGTLIEEFFDKSLQQLSYDGASMRFPILFGHAFGQVNNDNKISDESLAHGSCNFQPSRRRLVSRKKVRWKDVLALALILDTLLNLQISIFILLNVFPTSFQRALPGIPTPCLLHWKLSIIPVWK